MVISHERKDREEMRQYAAEALGGLYRGAPNPSDFVGGRTEALRRLAAFDATTFNATHNDVRVENATSRLSPYIRHGLLSLREVRDSVVARFGADASRGFILQLLWRVFWYLSYRDRNLAATGSLLPSGATPSAEELAAGAENATEERAPHGFACIDEPLRQLTDTGYIPYVARLWVASYLLHWRGIDWREGYHLFQEHLVDADPVVNSFSWRWVLGEITGRPYFFNKDRVMRETAGQYCARCTAYRCPFQGTLEAVEERVRKPGAMLR